MGKWFVQDVVLAAAGEGGAGTGEARVQFQVRSQAEPGQQGALKGELPPGGKELGFLNFSPGKPWG